MIVIKGNLIVNKIERATLPSLNQMIQNRKSNSSVIESDDSKSKEIICFVDLSDYDTTGAIVIEGNTVVSSLDVGETILVTEDISEIGGIS